MDVYTLGYCVVHSRGSWKVCGIGCGIGNIGAEALEMLSLVNGISQT